MSSVPLSCSCSKYLVPTALQLHWNRVSLSIWAFQWPSPSLLPSWEFLWHHSYSLTCTVSSLAPGHLTLLYDCSSFKPLTLSPTLTLIWCYCFLLDEAYWIIGRLPACSHLYDSFVTTDGKECSKIRTLSSFVHWILFPLTFKIFTLSFSLLAHHWFFLLNWLLLWACKHGIIYLIIKKKKSFCLPFPHHASLFLFTTKRLETIIYMHSLPFPVETLSVATFINFQPSSHLTY